jgi:RimJ/RimL family protein N-acetyltransferase
MHPVRIDGPRAGLRELAPDDAEAVHAVYGDPLATRHLSFEPRTPEQVAAMIARSMESAVAIPRVEYALGVTVPGGGDLVGVARLATEPDRAATIGFALRPDHWGRGLGTETVRLLCHLGFAVLGVHRVWAARSPANTASERTLLKAGMTEDGRIRDHVFVRGAWRDSITYSILEHEWSPPGPGWPAAG